MSLDHVFCGPVPAWLIRADNCACGLLNFVDGQVRPAGGRSRRAPTAVVEEEHSRCIVKFEFVPSPDRDASGTSTWVDFD